jgi:hypothetical protein
MAMAITTNIANEKFTRGDTFVQRITVRKTDGTPKDITGATARYTVRTPNYSGTQVLQKTTGSGIQLTTPSIGVLDVTVPPNETILLIPDTKYEYDCEVTLSGEVNTVQKGQWIIEGDSSQ